MKDTVERTKNALAGGRIFLHPGPSMSEWVLHILHERGGQTLDEIGALLPNANWAQLFLAIDKLTRDGAIELRFAGRGEYWLNLRHAERLPVSLRTSGYTRSTHARGQMHDN